MLHFLTDTHTYFFLLILQDSGKDPPLPLVDSHAQHQIQKRIVVEKLSHRSVFTCCWISASEIFIHCLSTIIMLFNPNQLLLKLYKGLKFCFKVSVKRDKNNILCSHKSWNSWNIVEFQNVCSRLWTSDNSIFLHNFCLSF